MNLYKKRTDYKVGVQKEQPGVRFYNFLEEVEYVTDEKRPYVLTGLLKEKWPVSRENLLETYDADKYIDTIDKGIPVKVGIKESNKVIAAYQTTEKEEVKTSWGDVLIARPGDWIVNSVTDGKINENDRWVIDGRVFLKTYKKIDE